VRHVAEHRSIDLPYACIEAIEASHQPRAGSIGCVIGRNVSVDPQVLSAYCSLRPLTTRMHDLILMAGVIAFADKIVRRRHSVAWRRELEIAVPVYEPDFWQQDYVIGTVQEALGFLTGDIWNFAFRPRRGAPATNAQRHLKLGHGRVSVMPYSDGLDSFAAARLAAASEHGSALILVTTGRKKDADVKWRTDRLDGQRRRISVPFRLSDEGAGYEFRESSYRSRAFVFGVMAGLAAYLSDSIRVIVPESGQGTFGPWLLPVGNESPDIHSHPLFTSRLARFLELVIGTRVRFEHPWRWQTKGETLHALRDLGPEYADEWEVTHSCARRSYHVSLDRHRAHCGVCAACLLRRQSILRAGLDQTKDRYGWRELSTGGLAAAVASNVQWTTDDDRRHAICGVLALSQLAELPVSKGFEFTVTQAASELAEVSGESFDTLKDKFIRLIKAHRDEWQAFVARQGPRSFIAQWADAIAC